MAEYIERDTVLKKFDARKKLLDARLRECKPCDPSYNMYAYQISELIEARGFASSAPAADVALVVHGRWEKVKPVHYKCSVCGINTGGFTSNYCPNCGAKMDKEALDGLDAP